MPEPLPRLVTVTCAVRRLGVCARTIRRWIQAGKLPATRYPSGRYAISLAALESILPKK